MESNRERIKQLENKVKEYEERMKKLEEKINSVQWENMATKDDVLESENYTWIQLRSKGVLHW